MERAFAFYAVVAYFIAQAALLLLWKLRPESDRRLSILSGLVLVCGAGLRTGGFDYDNYLRIIGAVHDSGGKSLLIQVFLAKDPLMLAVIDGCDLFSDSTRPVFVAMAVLAVVPKLIGAQKLSGRATVFMSLYSIFFAPALEFAAIRASVALGLLMLLLAFEARLIWKIVLSITSVFAHVSALPMLVALRGTRFMSRPVIAILPLICAVLSFEASGLLWLFPRSVGYQNNVGTLLAYLPAALSYVIYLISNVTAGKAMPGGRFSDRANMAAAVGIGCGLGLSPASVTIAYRFMDMGWMFLVAVLIIRARWLPHMAWRLSYQVAVLGILILTMGMLNTKLDVWNLPI